MTRLIGIASLVAAGSGEDHRRRLHEALLADALAPVEESPVQQNRGVEEVRRRGHSYRKAASAASKSSFDSSGSGGIHPRSCRYGDGSLGRSRTAFW